MNGQMDERVGGWVDRWADEWIGECVGTQEMNGKGVGCAAPWCAEARETFNLAAIRVW